MNKIKQLRKERGLTLQELSDILLDDYDIKTSTGQLSSYENGKRSPRNESAWEAIADYFGVSVGYLLGYSDKEERSSSIELKNDIRRELIEQLLEANRRETAIDRGFSMQGLLDENSALRGENRRLTNELMDNYPINAKANLLDIIISDGYILQSTLDKCISKLNEIDQQEIRKVL